MWRLCGASNQLFMPFQGQNGVLELSIQGHEDVFEVQYWNCFNLISKADLVLSADLPSHSEAGWPVCDQRQEQQEA